MKSSIPTIIVVAFSRPKALHRSLTAINNAYYRSNVRLIISLDGGAFEEVVAIAEDFQFSHGEKLVFRREDNIGLKNHILECGDLSESEGSVIVLEDDIVVDKFFHIYAHDALSFYEDADCIAGISLYAPEYNEYAGLPFSPLQSEYDTYFMQVPCSWGQAWTSGQWFKFREWLKGVDDSELLDTPRLPDYVKKWKSSSWKKYYALYLVQCDKSFVYPYTSLTTNVSDPGGFHNVSGSNIVQVHLASQSRGFRDFHFSPVVDSALKYDSFMENCTESIFSYIKDFNQINGSICLDLYGIKPIGLLEGFDYCITSKATKAKIFSYKPDYRPVENNILFDSKAGSGHPSFKLTKTLDLCSANTQANLNELIYWAGFNFFSKKYIFSNIEGLIKRIWSKL